MKGTFDRLRLAGRQDGANGGARGQREGIGHGKLRADLDVGCARFDHVDLRPCRRCAGKQQRQQRRQSTAGKARRSHFHFTNHLDRSVL
jgi:hypothetical protein